MVDHLFVRSSHFGTGEADGGGSVWEVQKVKKTNVSVHTKAHIAILLMPALEGGCHYAAKGSALDRISAHAL